LKTYADGIDLNALVFCQSNALEQESVLGIDPTLTANYYLEWNGKPDVLDIVILSQCTLASAFKEHAVSYQTLQWIALEQALRELA